MWECTWFMRDVKYPPPYHPPATGGTKLFFLLGEGEGVEFFGGSHQVPNEFPDMFSIALPFILYPLP
jgi:hypothetical protein